MHQGIMAQFEAFLPLKDTTPRFTLGEGNTPLVQSRGLAELLGIKNLYFKLEGCNPTGSFKDRGMVMAVAHAVEDGRRAIICASTGNTSASAAAYGAYCKLTTIVLVPKGKVAYGKLSQAIAYGAEIVIVDGGFDKALDLVRELSKDYPIDLVNSVNPYRLEGQKTASFEIADALTDAPDYICIPVGNAGNITAYWKGFKEYSRANRITRTPRMMGFQAEGAAPIVQGETISEPETIASAIRIGNPASWQGALDARDESGGLIDSVTDAEILAAYKLLARTEGIFCEPASAASVAGLTKLRLNGTIPGDKSVVCIITGTGLKDPELAMNIAGTPLQELPPDITELREIIAKLVP